MLDYTCLSYQELDIDSLYAIMRLRQEVFVVEQNCPYLDLDDHDQKAFHVIGKDKNGRIEAYARIFDKGISYEKYQSIGRIITSIRERGKGEGANLVSYAILKCKQLYGTEDIKISAQSHLRKFYERFGFQTVGQGYLEDNIPHHAMLLKSSA